ncbi:hypothetical protein DFH06DRAFT_1300540 [Mycena polygramma]|nr:hypothetical protein DFH06DRAFT_1300540 [Mycena polygramma]
MSHERTAQTKFPEVRANGEGKKLATRSNPSGGKDEVAGNFKLRCHVESQCWSGLELQGKWLAHGRVWPISRATLPLPVTLRKKIMSVAMHERINKYHGGPSPCSDLLDLYSPPRPADHDHDDPWDRDQKFTFSSFSMSTEHSRLTNTTFTLHFFWSSYWTPLHINERTHDAAACFPPSFIDAACSGGDSSRSVSVLVEPTGTGKKFVAAKVTKNGNTSVKSTAGFGNCVVVTQTASSSSPAVPSSTADASPSASTAAAAPSASASGSSTKSKAKVPCTSSRKRGAVGTRLPRALRLAASSSGSEGSGSEGLHPHPFFASGPL